VRYLASAKRRDRFLASSEQASSEAAVVSEYSGTAAVIALLNLNIAGIDRNQVCKFSITAGL